MDHTWSSEKLQFVNAVGALMAPRRRSRSTVERPLAQPENV
jgi:hypothetical protein